MKTLSLKMLLVAALLVSPAVVMADADVSSKAPATSYVTQATAAISGAASTVASVPTEIYKWTQKETANTVAAAIIAAFLAKEAYAYMTAPAKAKTVKAN